MSESCETALAAMNEDLEFILGRPCFWFIEWARLWRDTGTSIETKAEAEQAFFIHWMLNLYLAHPKEWRGYVTAEIARREQERSQPKARTEGGE